MTEHRLYIPWESRLTEYRSYLVSLTYWMQMGPLDHVPLSFCVIRHGRRVLTQVLQNKRKIRRRSGKNAG